MFKSSLLVASTLALAQAQSNCYTLAADGVTKNYLPAEQCTGTTSTSGGGTTCYMVVSGVKEYLDDCSFQNSNAAVTSTATSNTGRTCYTTDSTGAKNYISCPDDSSTVVAPATTDASVCYTLTINPDGSQVKTPVSCDVAIAEEEASPEPEAQDRIKFHSLNPALRFQQVRSSPGHEMLANHDSDDRMQSGLIGSDEEFIPKWAKTYAKLEAKDDDELNVISKLHEAAEKGQSSVVRSLVKDSHVNPNSRNAKGWTAILRASKMGHKPIVEFLCAIKADLDTTTKTGLQTPLMKAASKGRVDITKILVGYGADINKVNKGGATALMIACMHKKEGVASVLIENGAQLDIQKDVGYTAMMLAARQGLVNTVKLMLEHNADPSKADYEKHETAIDKAQKYNRVEVVRLLEQHCGIEPKTRALMNGSSVASRGGMGSRSGGYAHSRSSRKRN